MTACAVLCPFSHGILVHLDLIEKFKLFEGVILDGRHLGQFGVRQPHPSHENIGFMFNSQLGSNITNILPAVGVLLMLVTKVLSVKEVTSGLASDMVFMIAGMSVMSDMLAATGVGELIGETVLNILGGNPSALFVSVVFCVFTTIMTNFMSNMGTMALMSPIAASTALVGGMNPKSLVLIVTVSAWFAIVMPTGCAGAMIAFGTGNHNPFKTMKFTLPLVLLMMAGLIIGVNLFFSIYG